MRHLLVLVTFVLGLAAASLAASVDQVGSLRVGKAVPNRIGMDVAHSGNELVSPEEMLTGKGTRQVVISFFQTTCAPCIKEISEFKTRREELHSKGVEVFLVAVKEDTPEMRRLFKSRGWDFVAIADRFDGDYSQQCGVIDVKGNLVLPTTLLVSRGKGGMVLDAAWQGGEDGVVEKIMEQVK